MCVELQCLDRTRFFSGQLLTEADLNNEQSYWLAKSRLHNRFLHGWGVVCGMQVVCSDCDGWVTVKPGYAIDPCGNDIIVCSEQPFNVIRAIQACCTPSKQTANCAPLRATPPATCQDARQTWCITIEYQEEASRLVAPLKQAAPKSGSCSCGSTKGGCGCGCGCGGGAKNGTHNGSVGKCSCSSTQTQTASVPTGACEPTRINEGFRLCVVPAPPMEEPSKDPLPGSAAYQARQCILQVEALILQAPKSAQILQMDPQSAFTAVCNFLIAVKRYFAMSNVTHCDLLDQLNQIVVPSPTGQNGTYLNQLVTIVTKLGQLIVRAAFDCICMSLIPACPPNPCDDRVSLAQVTVQGGKIVDICHFACRKQLVTLPVLYYWLSLIGFDRTLQALVRGIESFCCAEFDQRQVPSFGRNLYAKDSLTTAGFTNPAMVNALLSNIVAQSLGANLINAASPESRAVNLRDLAGQPLEKVNSALASHGFTKNQLNVQSVDADPFWTADAVAAAAQFAPAAVSVGQPLTIYTKGDLAVGFDVTDPTQARLDALQAHVADLEAQLHTVQGRPAGNIPPRKKK